MFASTAILVLVILLRCDRIVDSSYINLFIVTLLLHSDLRSASTAILVLVILLRCDLIVDSSYMNLFIITLLLHSDLRSILCL
jgi:hypothetical protein